MKSLVRELIAESEHYLNPPAPPPAATQESMIEKAIECGPEAFPTGGKRFLAPPASA